MHRRAQFLPGWRDPAALQGKAQAVNARPAWLAVFRSRSLEDRDSLHEKPRVLSEHPIETPPVLRRKARMSHLVPWSEPTLVAQRWRQSRRELVHGRGQMRRDRQHPGEHAREQPERELHRLQPSRQELQAAPAYGASAWGHEDQPTSLHRLSVARMYRVR